MTTKAVLAAVAAAGALALGGCGGDDGDGNDYPQSAVDNFTRSCEQQGASRAACSCSIERIQDRYTFAEFQKIDEDAGTGRSLPAAIAKIAEDCRREQG